MKIAHVEVPATAENERRTRSGKFTLGQLRQTDGLVPLQSGTNQFDSQKFTVKGFIVVHRSLQTSIQQKINFVIHLHDYISMQNNIMKLQGKTGFGMPRNTALNVQFADKGKKWTIEQLRATDSIIRLQSGTNKYDSQRGMTGFGTPRDVRGKHLKRLWELEFPEETVEEIPQMNPVNATPLNPSKQPPAVLPKPVSH
uniref:Uncharacterized protein n=1 Tax=Onchocerca volvulus TaxID=6282 RepID=A0A8R1Y254_ONCVO